MTGSKPAATALITGCVASSTSYATHPVIISSISRVGVLVGIGDGYLDGLIMVYALIRATKYIISS